jgi:zinc protease
MAGSLLMRGTKNKSRQQIQDEMDRLKAEINLSGGATTTGGGIQTVEANLPGALRLLAELVKEPSFPDTEFEQVRQQLLANLESAKSEPQALGSLELARHFRPYQRGDSRYVSNIEERIEDLKKVTLEEARKFYSQFYGASNGELVIVGQFDPAAIQKLAAELFGQWKSPSSFARVSLPYSKVEPIGKKIETPDKQNALLSAGMTTPLSMDDPDYPASMLANRIFGGTFASRLVHRIRDKEGLSYGVNSSFSVNGQDDGASFTLSAICAPQNLPKVESTFKEELARALKDGFTAEEVAAEKKAWLDQLVVVRTQDGSLASTLLNRERFDRTMKFDEAMEAKVSTLTADEVNAAFRKHLDPSAFSYVRAGDFKKAGVLQ